MKHLSLVILLSLVSWSPGAASDFAISLDSVAGLYGPNSLNTNQQLTFYFRLTNAGADTFKGIANGYRVYSPNGATWDTTVGNNDLGTIGPAEFDLIWHINEFGLTGSGADTLGFGGSRGSSGTGLPAGFDDTAYTITIGPISSLDHSKTICLDSAYYPPIGLWKWDGGIVDNLFIGVRFPNWDGPHCFTVLDAAGSQCLLPNPAVIKLETVEGNPSAGQLLEIDVFDNGDPLSFALTNDSSWLELSATSGTTPATITASASVAGPAGEYRGAISVTAAGAGNSPLEVPVVLRVSPALTAMPYWGFFVFATGGNQAPAETLVVTATDGVSNIPFTAIPDSTWLTVTPSFGITPETLTVVSDARQYDVGRILKSNLTVTPDDDGLSPIQVFYRVKIEVAVTVVRDIDDGVLPTTYTLSQNYPNPFNPSTEIAFDLPTRTQVTLTVYNVLGQQVTTLVNEPLAAGSYVAEWDGRSSSGATAASGIYFYRLHSEQFTQTKKMVLLK